MSIKIWQQKLWQIDMIAVISSGVRSCAVSSQAESWWNKYTDIYHPEVAKIVNQTVHPVVITSWLSLMSFSHVFEQHVGIQPLVRQSGGMPTRRAAASL